MGEKLFDDLARALVEPVPRSRALRLMGSILVATSLPGAAFARSRRPARRTSFECEKEDGFGGQECCTGDICCGNKNCCTNGQKCDPTGRCVKCRSPFVRCGPKCCVPRSTCCTRPRTNTPAGFPGSLRVVCCKPPNACRQGICKCPSGKAICNGTTCCKQDEYCSNCVESNLDSGAAFAGRQKCCARGFSCCGNTCIDRALTCCKGKACPRSKPYCSIFGDCCAEEQFAIRGDVGVCCPAGTVATADGSCCPPGQETC